MAHSSATNSPSFIGHINNISVEDLQYIERDLCFHELTSLGFLLFGEDRPNAEFILQKLLVLSNVPNCGHSADLLRKFAMVKPDKWRLHLVEALAIIGARRVLRKLGFVWEELRQFFLPHITELSLYIHPLLKALYKVCEQMTPAQAGRLVLDINEQNKGPDNHLRFYDFSFLELFLLHWITRRIINVGDSQLSGVDVQALVTYFKLNDMDELKFMLLETINHNSEKPEATDEQTGATPQDEVVAPVANDAAVATSSGSSSSTRTCTERVLESSESYTVRREQAGYILIINQKFFYEETNKDLQHLLPKEKLRPRQGTDVDKGRLKRIFADFGYTPEVYDDLTHIELLHRIREVVKRSVCFDSLIVCILSHGFEGVVYGSNSIPVEISEIEHIITADSLRGNPKMLIIQACQKDDAVVEKVRTNVAVSADKFIDVIKAMSTVPGYPSIRDTATGTWFIQSLCDAVQRLGDTKHMLDILIAVARDVTNKRGDKNELMVPSTSHTLTKYFYLPIRM